MSKMKVERITKYTDSNNKPVELTFRVLDTTCPRCKQHVQFALLEDEYVIGETQHLHDNIDWLKEENLRLKKVIDQLLRTAKTREVKPLNE